MAGLTTGIIPKIADGCQPVDPCLQILSMKRMPNGEHERYRLLVSDGQWSSSFAMLATQLNYKMSNGEITNFSIIQLNKYICNTVQGHKKVLIILDLTVIKLGEETGGKLGNPVTYEIYSQNQESRGQAAPAYKNPPAKSNFDAPAPSAAVGGNAQRNPLAQRKPQNFGGSPARTPNGGTAHPISSLTPYQNRWTICARVTGKTAIRTWSNARGEGKLFSMDLLDESGEIRITAFNEQVDKFHDMMEINKVYFIAGGTLKPANKQFCNLNNEYEITCNRMTEITPCHESTDIPTLQYAFISLDNLEKLAKDTIVDVIGICKETMEVSTVTQRSTGKELKKRDVQIVDDSNHEIRITLWGTSAENFDGSLQPVIAIKGAKTSDFNGVSLSLLSSSSFQINPDIREAHKLKGWFENGGSSSECVNLSNQRGGGGGGAIGNVFTTFAEAKLQNLGGKQEEQVEYYSNKAALAMIRKENCLYTACPTKGCNKKVIDMNNGMYRCEKCAKEYSTFDWRLLLSVNLADITDHQWVTIFQDHAEMILGVSAQDIGSLKDNNVNAFNKIFEEATFKSFNFRFRVKMETYNDESRLKTTVVQCSPVGKEYNQRLISEIRAMCDQTA